MRIVAASLLVLSVSGCTFVEEVFLSPSEKVNRAFPPSADVRVAEESLRNLLGENETEQDKFTAQYEALREVRGLVCATSFPISKFDSVADIKKLPLSRDCLNAQDEILLRFLQVKQVQLRLAQAALRPMTPFEAPVFVSPGIPIYSGVAASTAGVAVLRGTRGELLSIEIPSGKAIAKLPTLGEAQMHGALLSPNGRVLALSDGFNKGVIFIDTETGDILWRESKIQQLLVWLPELSAALAKSSDGQIMVIDFKSGDVAVGLPALKRPSWAVPLVDGSIAIGTGRMLSLVTYERGANGIQGSILKSLTLKSGPDIISSQPTAMQDGRVLLFGAREKLMTLDLESGDEKQWSTGRSISTQYAKLSETTVLVDSYESVTKTLPWALNIEDATISPIETKEGSNGLIYELRNRAGFMRRNHDGVWFGLHLQQGKPRALDEFISERNLEREIAKLEAMTSQQRNQSALGEGGVRWVTPSADLPSSSNMRPPKGVPGDFSPPFAEVAKDALIEGVGVYESSSPLPTGPGNRPGSVNLAIRPTAKPLILVLSSYESVTWRITEGKEHVKLILLTSYYPSSVEGAGNARVVVFNGGHAYERKGEEYLRLRQSVMKETGKDIRLFQGSYKGASFVVGGQ